MGTFGVAGEVGVEVGAGVSGGGEVTGDRREPLAEPGASPVAGLLGSTVARLGLEPEEGTDEGVDGFGDCDEVLGVCAGVFVGGLPAAPGDCTGGTGTGELGPAPDGTVGAAGPGFVAGGSISVEGAGELGVAVLNAPTGKPVQKPQ